jgi:RNA polymerase sigma-70 factor (sigma-E family)
MIERRREDRSKREFERFVAAGADDLVRTAYLMGWDLAEAEDLVQESLMRVAKRWPRVRSMEHPLAYARRILVNLALDGAERRSRHRGELDTHDGVQERADEASSRDLAQIDAQSEVVQALATLPPRQRAVLVLRYFVDLPEAEVAATLGCSLGTVKSTTSRGLARLEQELRPKPPELVPRSDHTRSDAHDPATRS